MRALPLPLALSLGLIACAAEPTPLDLAAGETGLGGPFDPVPDERKLDRGGARGPRVRSADTEVWAVGRSWTDVEGEPGIAWEAGSGLTWEQKHDAWVASFERTRRETGWGETFIVRTPHGTRELPAPTLECAEVALLLRATFASWYGLPFFLQGWDSHTRQTIYAGHFGFVDADGERVARFPRFRSAYRDHTGAWSDGDEWPTDERLRGYRLGDDDAVPFLGPKAGAGAYFDELFLNKRVGYFLRLLLLYFGSANLADGANMFHVVPERVTAGDVLLERWQRRGIGHTIPVMRVDEPVAGRFAVEVATGSMPRRQPIWEEPASARHYFTLAATGGVGESGDGTAYAKLGGGLRRWRTAVVRDGRWRNVVLDVDAEAYVDDADEDAIAARPERFAEILADVSPEERRDAALERIESARMHLRTYPASCAARTRREDAFADLYDVMEADFGTPRAEVDATYRTLEDFVLAELEYEQSKTCCWSSTTPAMFEIVMSYAEDEQARAEADGVCAAPTVFRAEAAGDGYDRWRAHAESLGRAAEWVAWSEDETCGWRDVPEDAPTGRGADRCTLDEPPADPPAGPADGCDPAGGDDDRSRATPLDAPLEARICEGDDDWYRVDAAGTRRVRIAFRHTDGDLDMEAVAEDGTRVAISQSVTDEEAVEAEGPFWVRVYGYGGATNAYVISVH